MSGGSLDTGSELMRALSALETGDANGALCIVVKTTGSAPARVGAMMIVFDDGSTVGTVGGGGLEEGVRTDALRAMKEGEPSYVEHHLVRDHAMCCGGSVDVFIRPLPGPERLYIFGAGHIGREVARVCDGMSYDVTVIDDRPGIFDDWVRGRARTVNRHPRQVMPELVWNDRVHVVIVTNSHPLDREILAFTLKQPHVYCGMIGSRRKVAVTRSLFIDQHWATPDELDRVDMPIGLDIGAVTPQEIAISVAGRLVEVRRGGGSNVGSWPLAVGGQPVDAECCALTPRPRLSPPGPGSQF